MSARRIAIRHRDVLPAWPIAVPGWDTEVLRQAQPRSRSARCAPAHSLWRRRAARQAAVRQRTRQNATRSHAGSDGDGRPRSTVRRRGRVLTSAGSAAKHRPGLHTVSPPRTTAQRSPPLARQLRGPARARRGAGAVIEVPMPELDSKDVSRTVPMAQENQDEPITGEDLGLDPTLEPRDVATPADWDNVSRLPPTIGGSYSERVQASPPTPTK